MRCSSELCHLEIMRHKLRSASWSFQQTKSIQRLQNSASLSKACYNSTQNNDSELMVAPIRYFKIHGLTALILRKLDRKKSSLLSSQQNLTGVRRSLITSICVEMSTTWLRAESTRGTETWLRRIRQSLRPLLSLWISNLKLNLKLRLSLKQQSESLLLSSLDQSLTYPKLSTKFIS